jgi:hypothetical protein
MRKLSKINWYVALLLTMHGLTLGGLKPTPSQASEVPLELRIIAPESTVCSGSALTVEVDLRNTSDHPLSLRPQGISAIHFQTSRPVPNQVLPEFDSLDKNAAASEGPTESIVLQPGASYRYSIRLKDDFFKLPGFYKVSLEYDGSVHGRTKARLNALPVFDGHLKSNWLIFEVEECGNESATGGAGSIKGNVKRKFFPRDGG